MATLSLKHVAQNCLGLSGDLSLNTDVYGYPFRDMDGSLFGALDSDDTFPATGQPTARSLKQHLETISGRATDLVVILVGHEDDFSGWVSPDQVTKIQYAIQVARDLYAQAGLGIRRLTWQRIPVAKASGYDYILDKDEATELTEDFSGPDGGIDVFFVQWIADAGGWSNTGGPCDKDAKDERTGAVITLSMGRRFTGIVLGHEVGHYLGLKHTNSMANMMGSDVDNDGIGETNNNSTNIPDFQAATMLLHCSVNPAC